MKKLGILKIVQLTITILLTLVSLICLMTPGVKQFVFADGGATVLFFVVWVILIVNYVFILLDLRVIANTKLDFNSLYEAAYADPVSGMPNRFSCDVLIDKYRDEELPEDIGCVMIEMTNLPEINSKYTHSAGNKALKRFSAILTTASLSQCFVGRNGGNKFLAIFEKCDQAALDNFLASIDAGLASYQKEDGAVPISYRAGTALNSEERLRQITELIALANRRVYHENVYSENIRNESIYQNPGGETRD